MKTALRFLTVSVSALAATLTLSTGARAQEISDNYVGVGAATDGFAVNGRVVVGDSLSLRPAFLTDVEFGDDDTEFSVFLPVTYDFESPFKNYDVRPFAGAGLGGTNRDDGEVGAIATVGADYDISERLVLNGSVVWSLFDDGRTDAMIGLGYRF